MQFLPKTLGELRPLIGRLMRRGQYISGNVLASPAPTSTTFVLTDAKKYPDEHFRGMIFYAISGTGAGQSVFCESSEKGSGIITVTPALDVTFDATTLVEGWPDEISPDDIKSNIQLAVAEVADMCNVYVEVPEPDLDSSRRVIAIPDSFVKLCEFRYLDSGGCWRIFRYSHSPDLPGVEQGRDFSVLGRSIYLSECISSEILDADIVITGYRLPTEVLEESDLVEVPPAFIVFRTAAFTEQALIGNVDLDPEGHERRANAWMVNAQQQKNDMPVPNYRPTTIILDTGATS